MEARFVGIQDLNFKNDKGETIIGKNLYIVYEDENVTGLKASKLFLKEGTNLPKDVKLNDTLELRFNMKGKIEMIYKV